MRRIFRLIRQLGSQVLQRTGLLKLIVKLRLKKQGVAITYHRVLDNTRADMANSNSGIVVSEEVFDMHMRTVRREFNPISLSEFRFHVESGTPMPPRSCLVTFDDGWLDNYEVAFPILKKYQIPAVIFLPVSYISSSKMFWQEEVLMRLSLMRLEGDGKSLERLKSILNREKTSREPTNEDIERFVIELKSLDYEQLEIELESIRAISDAGVDSPHYNRYLSWEQVAEMRDAGIEFASHGMSHRILSSLSEPQCRDELEQSREALKERFGQEVTAIAYPNGDYDERVLRETARAGYTLAFTTRPGFVNSQSDALQIPRINLHNGNSGTEARFICACARIL